MESRRACNQEFFRALEVSWNEGTLINIFFLLDVLNITFQIRHLTHRWTQSGYFPFSPKSGHFFRFLKSAGKTLPPSPAPYARFCIYILHKNHFRHKAVCNFQTVFNYWVFVYENKVVLGSSPVAIVKLLFGRNNRIWRKGLVYKSSSIVSSQLI